MSDALAAAENWLALGIAPIPIVVREKKPARPWAEYQSTLPTYPELVSWFGNGSNLNLAIVCGWRNLTTLDFDSLGAWRSWSEWLERDRPQLVGEVDSARQSTTARGRHLYVRLAQPARTRPLRALGIDIKAAGGYVLVPPSIHPSGIPYRHRNPATAYLLSCDSLSDILPPEALVEAALQDQQPGDPVRVVLPDMATVASADPWAVAENTESFDRARGLARIKAHFRIEDWFPNRVPSSRDRRWWTALCPFHADARPSFWIDTQRQLCGCHAGCNSKPWDVIDFFARWANISNDEAIRVLSRGLDGG